MAALRAVQSMEEVELTAYSSVYETPPWGIEEQPAFYNMVACIETEFAPVEVLHRMQRIETALGRVRDIHWGPRTMDIDLLCMEGGETVKTEELQLPHPYLLDRAFVLVPLAEIAPTLVLGAETIENHAARLPDVAHVVRVDRIAIMELGKH